MFVKGTNYRESEPVYPTQNTEWNGIFPDGTLFKKDKQPSYVFEIGRASCRERV